MPSRSASHTSFTADFDGVLLCSIDHVAPEAQATLAPPRPPHLPTLASLDLMSRSITSILYHLIFAILRIVALGFIGYAAYSVRMHAINIYGLVIHEFDPWFNFRATQYLADNGPEKFFRWFDYMSWSPLGRPVGTTIYPGMQLLSVYLWKLLNYCGLAISLNDVCCYVPVWGGITATMLIGATTYVSTGSANAAVFASAVMSVIPAHIMRSVGGGFDNESVAISALCLTFMFWTYSLSGKDANKPSYLGGILTGLAYICMVASWGGYIFVCNVIALHAFVLVLLGRYSKKLYWAYTLWYLIGTTGAIQVPVVGLTPLKSLEQMAPLAVFFGMQGLQFCELSFVLKAFGVKNPSKVTNFQRIKVRAVIFFFLGLIAASIIYLLWPTGYFGPLSARIRGLFVQHTRTGNPLVDSVAEHQPASPEAFWQFLHYACHSSPIGFGLILLKGVLLPLIRPKHERAADRSTDPLVFILTYASVTYFFATKMNRLMLLMGPVSSILSGVALGFMFDFVLNEIFEFFTTLFSFFGSGEGKEGKKKDKESKDKKKESDDEKEVASVAAPTENNSKANKTTGLKKRKTGAAAGGDKSHEVNSKEKETRQGTEGEEDKDKEEKKSKEKKVSTMDWVEEKLIQFYSFSLIRLVRLALAGGMVYIVYLDAPEFYKYSTEMAGHLSHPSIMFQARLRDGTEIMVDDYREAYWWLRDNTPEDSRIMAWWDYGYQITGIGNRTTIADGNTWNHEVSHAPLPLLPLLLLLLSLTFCPSSSPALVLLIGSTLPSLVVLSPHQKRELMQLLNISLIMFFSGQVVVVMI
jgi:dolichyl-diphosphooligosaccharide---protein glycosyltransferase